MKQTLNIFTRILSALPLAVVLGCSTPARDLPPGLYAEIKTNKGDIVIRLEPDKAPMTVMNFVGLAEGTIENSFRDGRPYYDGLTFHRVVPDFVIQGGDPEGTGSGGPGYRFPTETHPELLHDSEGVVAMANSGPDTNGSQFYITMAPTPHLDGGYNVFGRVTQGMDVVTEVEQGDVIRSVEIIRAGEQAESYSATTEAFNEMITEVRERREAEAAAQVQAQIDTVTSQLPGTVQFGDTRMLLSPLEAGAGDPPARGDTVVVHYSFATLDGTVIDNTRVRGEPHEFVYLETRVIEGLELAIGTMAPGARVVAIIPPELAFGEQALGPALPPNSHVVFEIERIR
jgi:peptidylprolyl isomerase